MMRLVIVLMTLAATCDAVPVATFVRAHGASARMACCCRNACECRQCPVHHRHAGGSPPAVGIGTDCFGCPQAGPAPMSPVSVRTFVPAATVAMVPAADFTPLVAAGAPRPSPAPSRSLEPPPRPAATQTPFSFS